MRPRSFFVREQKTTFLFIRGGERKRITSFFGIRTTSGKTRASVVFRSGAGKIRWKKKTGRAIMQKSREIKRKERERKKSKKLLQK